MGARGRPLAGSPSPRDEPVEFSWSQSTLDCDAYVETSLCPGGGRSSCIVLSRDGWSDSICIWKGQCGELVRGHSSPSRRPACVKVSDVGFTQGGGGDGEQRCEEF